MEHMRSFARLLLELDETLRSWTRERPCRPCHGPFHPVKLYLAPKISVSSAMSPGFGRERAQPAVRRGADTLRFANRGIAGDGSGLQTLASRLCIPVDVWSWTQSGKRIAPDQVAPPETHLDDHAAQIARFGCMAMRQWSLNTSPFATYHFFLASMDPTPGALSGITHHLSAAGPLVLSGPWSPQCIRISGRGHRDIHSPGLPMTDRPIDPLGRIE